MGIRRILPLLLIILMALGAYVYLGTLYNPKVIEYRYKGTFDWLLLKELEDAFGSHSYNINLETDYEGYPLIATTGKDRLMETIVMDQGNFLIEPYGYYTVIGDQVADAYFSSVDCLDKDILIHGTSYKIKGILKDSRAMYIPFSEEVEKSHWNRRTIRFIPKEDDNFYYLKDQFEGFLQNKGIQTKDTIVYKERMKAYPNLAILIIMIILTLYGLHLFKKCKIIMTDLWKGYKEEKRRVAWFDYLKENKIRVIQTLRYLGAILIMLLILYNLLIKLFIPPDLIPGNFFALSSYIEITKAYYKKWMFYLQHGFNPLGIDMIKLNIIILSFYVITSRIAHKRRHTS